MMPIFYNKITSESEYPSSIPSSSMPEEKFDCLVTSVTDLDSCAAVPLGISIIGERTVEDN